MIKWKDEPWTGLEDLPAELLAELKPAAINAVNDGANYFVGELKTTLTGARTGRAYRVSKTGKVHIASAPGEAPAVLFGALRNSVGRTDVDIVDGVTVQAYVGIGLGVRKDNTIAEGYAVRLEYGGVDSRGVRILPRPYLEPTRLRVEPVLDEMFAHAVGGR